LVRLREPSRLAVQLTGLANGFFVPMFFVLLGSRLDVRALASSPSAMLLAVALVGAAVVAHALAALVTRQRRAVAGGLGASAQLGLPRSEERRVGKGGGARGRR